MSIVQDCSLPVMIKLFCILASLSCTRAIVTKDVPVCVRKLDVAFVIDGSWSIGFTNFYRMTDALTEALALMNIGPNLVHAGALVFSHTVYEMVPLNGHYDELVYEFKHLTYQPTGKTRTDVGINVGREMFEIFRRSGVLGLLVVITDGKSNYKEKTIEEAVAAKNHGLIIYAVGIGHNVDRDELEKIITSPNNIFSFENVNDFKTNIKNLIDAVCKETE